MVDSTETDAPAEIVMDYVISWSLRCADVQYRDSAPILHRYARRMLAMLLGMELDASITFERIESRKQRWSADVTLELDVVRDGLREHHALLIEDKYYAPLRDTRDEDGVYRNQLEVYRKRFDSYYDHKSEMWHRHYALITCISREDPKFAIYEIAPHLGYRLFSLSELLGPVRDYELTESDIFNEFWLHW